MVAQGKEITKFRRNKAYPRPDNMPSRQALETNHGQETLRVGKARVIEVASRVWLREEERRCEFAIHRFSYMIAGVVIGGDQARSKLSHEMRK